MSGRSDEAYKRIQGAGNQVGDWLDLHVSKTVEENAARFLVVAGAVLVAVAGYVRPGTFLNSISAELIGIVIAAVVIDTLNERRQDEQLKAQLIRQMGGSIRDVAVPAVRELEHHGWLRDGSLSGANLLGANLSGAELRGANLSGANLWFADLSESYLLHANLSGAELRFANLSGANLLGANLSGAELVAANLSGAILVAANLSGADLREADLPDIVIKPDKWKAVKIESRTLRWSRGWP